MSIRLTFLGAAGTVTGSKFWLAAGSRNYLIDCGVFQGPPELEDRNWDPLAVDPKRLDAVILTHAHNDHSAYLPRLIKSGFGGPVYASEATGALLELLMPDFGYLQEEQANYANKKGYSRHKPAQPLYTYGKAVYALQFLRPVPIGSRFDVDKQLQVTMHPAGHILGSAILECDITVNGKPLKVVFSGDLGRYHQEFMKPPAAIERANYLVVESTYGDREHPREAGEDQLAAIVNKVAGRGGVLLIPSFAVGRAQQLLFYLRKLENQKRIPVVPVYIDSPMAINATEIYSRFGNEHNLDLNLLQNVEETPLRTHSTNWVRTVEDSKVLNERKGPIIIISASGMCEGGRILHHLKRRLPDSRNAVLFVGFQVEGTRGRKLLKGAEEVKIHGESVPVRAEIDSLDTLSAHGDYHDILKWLSGFKRLPQKNFYHSRRAGSGQFT
jgi:metallo-beta-lactamase family protein